MFETLFRGQNQPLLIALIGFAVLIVVVIVVRMVRQSKRWTPEDRAFYARLAKYQQRQALFHLGARGVLMLIILVLFWLSRR